MAERVLVTGAAGFLGSHLVERLTSEGHDVVGLDAFSTMYSADAKRRNLREVGERAGFRFVEGDIRDADLLERVFAEHRPAAVYHLAAVPGVRTSIQDPLLYEDVNVRGTLNVLQACRKHGQPRFVFGSSSSVYGASTQVPFRESDAADRPISPYAASKRAGELYAYAYHHLFGVPTLCARFFTVYGPRQRPDMAIHMFTRAIDAGRPVTLFGDGSSRRDYTFCSDVVDGLVRALRADYGYEVVNLGRSETTSLLDLIRTIEKAVGKPAQVEWKPDQPGDVPITYADVSRARSVLGYDPQVSVEEGVRRFVEWYRARAAEA